MRNILVILCLALMVGCQQQQQITVAKTYEEPKDPSPKTSQNWETLPNGLQASVSSIYTRHLRSEIPRLEQKTTWKGSGWRGERLSLQCVLWTKDSVNKVAVDWSNLVSDKGNTIPKQSMQSSFVKYVITDEFAEGCGYRKPQDFASSLAADVLEPVNSYLVKGKETRPLWLTIDIPKDAIPDTYNGSLNIQVEGQKSQSFKLSVKVIDKVLPPAIDWRFHLDLWQNPYAVARVHQVDVWSEEHWKLLKPIMQRLANAGQKVITVSLNKKPWGGQTYDPFEAMIQWKKNTDGTWDYDYTHFDNWVQFMMDLGVNKQISCYSMVPWGNEFYYFDEKENKEVKVKADPGTKVYESLWKPFLIAFKAHLVKKGWNKMTRIAMDERGPEEMEAMLQLLNKYAPEFGVSFADNHKSYKRYPEVLKDMSVAFGHPVDHEDLVKRREKNYISTHYVCCSDQFPNTFTFSPPAEGIFIGWYTLAADFDGFLRWAYNSWVKAPLQDSRFRTWPAGDTYLVYPDNRSSIRFETLRDGIEDAEKITVLRREFQKQNKQKALRELNALVAQFNITKAPDNLEKLLTDAREKLNALWTN